MVCQVALAGTVSRVVAVAVVYLCKGIGRCELGRKEYGGGEVLGQADGMWPWKEWAQEERVRSRGGMPGWMGCSIRVLALAWRSDTALLDGPAVRNR